MFISDVTGIGTRDPRILHLKCDYCDGDFWRTLKSAKQNAKKHAGKHKCLKCSGQPNHKGCVWTEDRKQQLSVTLRNSEALKASQQILDRTGSNNPMFGQKMSVETRAKMSRSRVGKTGINATGWKGGKLSLMRRVRKGVGSRFNWYRLVFHRDGWKCTVCGTTKSLDVHHINPLAKIAKKLLLDCPHTGDTDKLEWLLQQPEIIDLGLTNGITLCRHHHKEIHGLQRQVG